MYSTTIALCLLTGASFGLCAPAKVINLSASFVDCILTAGLQNFVKRDTCTLVGGISRDQSNFGPGDPVNSDDEGFRLYYVGGAEIGSSSFQNGGTNPFQATGPVTIDQAELNSAESIIVS